MVSMELARNNKQGITVYTGQVNAGMPEQMNEQMRGLKHEPMDAWMAEWTENREVENEENEEIWRDGWMDGWLSKCTSK